MSWKRTSRGLPRTEKIFRARSHKACSTISHLPLESMFFLLALPPSFPLVLPLPRSPCPRGPNSIPFIVRRAGYCWVVLSRGKEPHVGYPTRRRYSVPVRARHVVLDRTLPLELLFSPLTLPPSAPLFLPLPLDPFPDSSSSPLPPRAPPQVLKRQPRQLPL